MAKKTRTRKQADPAAVLGGAVRGVRTVPVSEIRPSPYNPREIDPEALDGLVESIRRHGNVQPLIVNERSGFLVGGHQRLRALERLGHAEALVVFVDLDEDEERLLNVNLNNPRIQGVFTEDVGDILGDLAQRIELPDSFDLAGMLEEIDLDPSEYGLADDEAEPPAPAPSEAAVVRRGDLWTVGPHRIVCGRCADADDVRRVLAPFLDGRGKAQADETRERVGLYMEPDPEECDALVRRVARKAGKPAILEASGETFEQVARGRGIE